MAKIVGLPYYTRRGFGAEEGGDWAYVGSGVRRQPWVDIALALTLLGSTAALLGWAAWQRDRQDHARRQRRIFG